MNEQKLKEKLKRKTLDTQISIRINHDRLDWLQQYANSLNVSLNKLIISILEQFEEEAKK